MQKTKIVCTALMLASSTALAHPGHGDSQFSQLLHNIIEPIHLIPVLGAILVAYLLLRRNRLRTNKSASQKKTEN